MTCHGRWFCPLITWLASQQAGLASCTGHLADPNEPFAAGQSQHVPLWAADEVTR
jgi:hypothetical protein